MAETRFIESEAILYAVREDEDGLNDYLADRERFTEYDLRALRAASRTLANACRDELEARRHRG